ncbi:MAG: MBL fold metallo-hydrolase [Acidobacteriaceae bacterium]|jgi:glyoxylase-like metal-dependent hydrolase (beta-lactamase superfamily II)
MKTALYVSAALLVLGVFLVSLRKTPSRPIAGPESSPRPELEYFKAVNRVAPPKDPQLLFLLMAQYSNANMQSDGVEFFSARLKEFSPRLTEVQKALYLSAIGLLRAQHAGSVSLLHRVGYVKDTITVLEQAKQLSGGQVFVVNWIAGVVYSQLPGFFGQGKAAQDELIWCEKHGDKAPDAGWLREVYYRLGKLALARGEQTKAQEYLKRSGYQDFNSPITLVTPFSEDVLTGHTFAPRRIAEIVPGRVYVLTGFEFTEYYFVVSDNGRELIGIDAGTRPDSAKAAYEALRAYAAGLPELKTVFVTHSHWDHIGGQTYFRSLNPQVRFYARSNYAEEISHDFSGPEVLAKPFFGERIKLEDIRNFKPDVLIDRRTKLTIGGTPIELIPVQGGETHDGMFVNLPQQGVMFVGDFIMPYLGAPVVQEGDLSGLLDAIDVVVQENPKYLLHGHEPLTRNFASTVMLSQLKLDLGWLRGQVLSRIRSGEERAMIQQENLIPPDLLGGNPDVYLPYFIMREHVIDRLYDQNVGYWQADLQGLDHISRADRAELLVDYLGLSEGQLTKTVERLTADGKYELAASLLESSEGRFEHSEAVAKVRRLVYLKLMEKNQNTDPFKYILYSAKIGEPTQQMAVTPRP